MTYALFFSHAPQLQWYALVAAELKRRWTMESIVWVIGETDGEAATAAGGFGEIVDLLDGFDPSTSVAKAEENRHFLGEVENGLSGAFVSRAMQADRFLQRHGWSAEASAHYAAHIARGIRSELDRRGPPGVAFGERNALGYVLAHRLMPPDVPFLHFASPRHWSDRMYWDRGLEGRWEEGVARYRRFLETGLPESLSVLAANKLAEVRGQTGPIWYVAQQARGGGAADGLGRKLKAARVGRAVGSWLSEVRRGEARRNPRRTPARLLNPVSRVAEAARQGWRRSRLHRWAKRELPPGPLASYFLHVQPEHTVEGLAFDFRDQAAFIEQLSARLPAHARLAVKEHRPMVGVRPASFYERIRVLPNVLLLSDEVSAHSVIRRSQVIFTLTGTVALDAMFLGKPAVMMGDAFFQDFDGIYRARNLDDLSTLVSRAFAGELAGASDDQALVALAATYDASAPGKLRGAYPMAESHSPENIRQVVDGLGRQVLGPAGLIPDGA